MQSFSSDDDSEKTHFLKTIALGYAVTENAISVLSDLKYNKGMSSIDISNTLSISKNTVSSHRQNILEKLQAKNSVEACKIAKEMKLI